MGVTGNTDTVYALAFLGRSFGVIPAARRLVRHGPYGVARHPLYAGELVAFTGVVLTQLTWFSAALFIAVVTIQVYRALEEEKVLVRAFPEYKEYSQVTARFIPGVL